MFKATQRFFLFFSGFITIHADNTPNLCSADIPNLRRIAPSETDLDIDPIPDITVGGETYHGNADHFVMIPSGTAGVEYVVNKIIVYLPGTTDRPEVSSCLLKSISQSLDYPTIGLSYAFLNASDNHRNVNCATSNTVEQQVECLEAQHQDAIYGGDYGATHFQDDGSIFWDRVDPANSITSRLGKLLKFLDHEYPGSGWDGLYYCHDNPSTPQPRWEKIMLMGHSQGAGHATYLGNTQPILGAVLISGPQDKCVNCPVGVKIWLDSPFQSQNQYTAFASGDESHFHTIQENWRKMSYANATDWRDPTDVEFAVSPVDACASPLYTHVKYAKSSTCVHKEHCSTALDDSVPFLQKSNGDKYYLYEKVIWPSIVTSKCQLKKKQIQRDSFLLSFVLIFVPLALIYVRRCGNLHLMQRKTSALYFKFWID